LLILRDAKCGALFGVLADGAFAVHFEVFKAAFQLEAMFLQESVHVHPGR